MWGSNQISKIQNKMQSDKKKVQLLRNSFDFVDEKRLRTIVEGFFHAFDCAMLPINPNRSLEFFLLVTTESSNDRH